MADKRLGYGKPKGNGAALIVIGIWVVVVVVRALIRSFAVSPS